MKFLRFLALAVTILTALQGCGKLERNTSLNSRDGGTRPATILAFGGNRSCKPGGDSLPSPLATDMARRLIGMVHLVRSVGRPVEVLTSCFTDPDRVLVSRNLSSTSEDLDFETLVEQSVSSSDENHSLFIIGHSYGGWIAMRTAERIAAQSGKIAGLVTIDPISRRECTYTNWDNCLSAPRDLSQKSLETIAANSGNWTNFYQTRTSYLHSSTIAQAHTNTQIDVDHFQIENHETIWRHLDRIMQEF